MTTAPTSGPRAPSLREIAALILCVSIVLLVLAVMLVAGGTHDASDQLGVIAAAGGALGLLIAAIFYASGQ